MDQIMSLLLCSLDLFHHYSNFPHQGSLSCWQTGLLRPSGCQPQLHVTMCGMISAPQLGSSLVMAMMSQQRLVLQKVASELHPKVRNHGEGPY